MLIMEQYSVMKKATLFIVGGSSTALEIRETVDRYHKDNYSQVYNIISDNEKTDLHDVVRDSLLLALLKSVTDIRFILGFTNIELRNYFYDILSGCGGVLVNVIHPNSYISSSAKIGIGNYIAANAVLSSNVLLGDSNLVNYNVTIGHDVIIGSDCFFNPGARVSGRVKIGNNCLLGANSFVFQGIEIGDNCQIDALSYIDRNIGGNSICSSNDGKLRIYKKRI